MQTTIVDGIERQGFSWITIECQSCKVCYTGGNGSTKEGPVVAGYKAYAQSAIRRDARALGWTGPMTRNSELDLCPECSKEIYNDDKSLSVAPRSVPVKITQWFKDGDHSEVEMAFSNGFIETKLPNGDRPVREVSPGDYIVESDGLLLVMKPEEVAENFVLSHKSNVSK